MHIDLTGATLIDLDFRHFHMVGVRFIGVTFTGGASFDGGDLHGGHVRRDGRLRDRCLRPGRSTAWQSRWENQYRSLFVSGDAGRGEGTTAGHVLPPRLRGHSDVHM
ncbi:hypothetical protein Ppa06_37760 [Planomonospora parontospora subsp. parontospora]|uniref:Pentapeptide repeat-containing protein n=2 Tax=Planomonospora parontospora TaxID=58119 RepID=A0AA37F620_9ACTN|nr:hypothetical protein GCM10010126_41150 [Planomonospora parontospora]GII09978.1 hypothetical protein Ppa06_37760 [Planomonospora parontospora subsp. parontospora]